jgi:RNA polymerase sigma factor (sigma-70 family)
VSTFQRATDAELFAAAPSDLAAFEALYRRHVDRVTAFATARCASADDVADAVAETFVRLLRIADQYDPARGEPAGFLRGVTANVVRDIHRRHTRHRALLSKLAGRDLLDDDDIGRLEAAIDAARAAAQVRAALAAAPSGDQRVLGLAATGRTARQTARELGISPDAARQRLARARRRVQTRLNDTPGGER